MEEHQRDVRVLAKVQDLSLSLADREEDAVLFEDAVVKLFDAQVREAGAGAFVFAVDAEGELVVSNRLGGDGTALDPWTLGELERRDWRSEPWFREAMETGSASLDVFRSDLVHESADVPWKRAITSASRSAWTDAGRAWAPEEPVGLVINLVPWTIVQSEISGYGVIRRRDRVSEFASDNIYDSTYAWVWADDADTILAHPKRELYGERVSGEIVALPQMVSAAQGKECMYPDYEFAGMAKKGAFRHCRSRDEGGYGWVVGVGVDLPDINGPIHEITSTIAKASALVLLVAVLVTIVVARRTTRPVQDLEAFTRRVASGDLDAQVPVRGHDELADLARSFNRMTRELKDNREELVKAEKNAAWREMARQVAHEIKNPLTPIQLSASLLRRAHEEQSPEFEAILERTTDVIDRQVRNMRDIAKDFYRFAGEHRAPVPVDAAEVLREVFDLNAAWAETEGIDLVLEPLVQDAPPAIVEADPDELRRALVNLVSNAIEAMEDGGAIRGSVAVAAGRVVITVTDTGKGIPDEVLERLFEPYFTTRSSGTGLGLAIVRRIIEDRGGEVSLENVRGDEGAGAVARISLPLVQRAEGTQG